MLRWVLFRFLCVLGLDEGFDDGDKKGLPFAYVRPKFGLQGCAAGVARPFARGAWWRSKMGARGWAGGWARGCARLGARLVGRRLCVRLGGCVARELCSVLFQLVAGSAHMYTGNQHQDLYDQAYWGKAKGRKERTRVNQHITTEKDKAEKTCSRLLTCQRFDGATSDWGPSRVSGWRSMLFKTRTLIRN